MRSAALFPLLALAGCAAVAPVPSPVLQAAASAGFVSTGEATASAAPVPERWWRLFNDAVLDRHVERALAANTDLRVALAHLDAARAVERQSRAARLPAMGIESGAGTVKAVEQPGTTVVRTTDYDIGATVAYEIDLFGRVRASTEAARADAEASAAVVDAARVTVAADVVAAYVDLCGAEAGAQVALTSVAGLQHSVQLVASQLREGEVSQMELSQAHTQLNQAQSLPPRFEADRKQALFRLATLQGKTPAEAATLEVGCGAPLRIESDVPVGDGTALLARRPDIREAERRVAAATARIGIATADLYPRITLGASGGLIAGSTDGFLTPLLSWAIVDGSGARARISAARGTAAAALAAWDAVVLRALREVESALVDFGSERSTRDVLGAALTEAERAVTRANSRYRLGADSYLLVLEAQRTRNDIAARLAASELRIARIQVALFRALGGGWERP